MPFTQAETTAFFEDADQMGIRALTMVQLQNEGITEVGDLSEYDSESLKQIAAGLRRPGGMIPCPTIGHRNGAPVGTLVP